MTNLTRALLLLLAALPLAADPLADVRTALGTLTGREPVRATYELQRNVANEGKLDNDKFGGKVSVELEADASGFRLVYPRPLLEQLEREQQAKARSTKKVETPTVVALQEIDPVGTADALDFAPVLLRKLEGAKLLSDVQGTWAGKPARVLVLRAADRIDEEDKGRVKVLENKITLWLGTDMVPLAAEHLANMKFSVLIFKGELKQKESWHFARVADRLVRARYESTQNSSGMGQKGSEAVVATVRVHS
ncbi:MAG: hypothetical protein ACLGH0_02885 [Thermoanaerobaculia bacterium]